MRAFLLSEHFHYKGFFTTNNLTTRAISLLKCLYTKANLLQGLFHYGGISNTKAFLIQRHFYNKGIFTIRAIVLQGQFMDKGIFSTKAYSQ